MNQNILSVSKIRLVFSGKILYTQLDKSIVCKVYVA